METFLASLKDPLDLHHANNYHVQVSNLVEISVKSGKDSSTSTLSLVIHRVRLKENLQKSTLAFRNSGW
jgi:hypothetical protein